MTKLDRKLLQFGHPRSGSSNIYQIFQLHPDLNIHDEPFSENFVKWSPGNKDYLAAVRDVPSLKLNVSEILENHDGFKMSNYQLEQELLEYLLVEANFKVIYTRRRNLLN